MVCPAAEVKEVEAIVTAATDGVVDVTGEAIFEVAAAAAAKAAIPVMLPC
jgi:regulator of PEP synthase PpsR (kinase-PPPase family)